MLRMAYGNSGLQTYKPLSTPAQGTSHPSLDLLSDQAAQCVSYPQPDLQTPSTSHVTPHPHEDVGERAAVAPGPQPHPDSTMDTSDSMTSMYPLPIPGPSSRQALSQQHNPQPQHMLQTDASPRRTNDTSATNISATLALAESPLSSTQSIDQYCRSISHSSPTQLAPSYLDSTGPKLDPFAISAFSGSSADYNWLFDDALLSLASADPLPDVSAAADTGGAVFPALTEQDLNGHGLGRGTRHSSFSNLFSQPGLLAPVNQGQTPAANRMEVPSLDNSQFFTSLLTQNATDGAHYVDGIAYGNLLDFLSALPELATSPYFTQASLQEYSNLFFTYFNNIYPLIHHGTFSASRADPMLLSAIVICGSYYSPHKEAHDLAMRISGKLWGALISADFEPAQATLQMLQAMMLTEAFGKFMSTRPQHETAHLFHNFVITLARRNALFLPAKSPSGVGPKRHQWKSWVEQEERKRAAFFAFILDAQHANTFRHVPSLSSFEIHLRLPCDEELWEARTEQKWSAILQKRERANTSSKPMHFIAALKAVLTPERVAKASDKDAFSEYILLHGLMSVSYNLCFKRDIFLTTTEKDSSENFWDRKARLRSAYSAWKLRLDQVCRKTMSATAHAILLASDSMVVTALIALHSDQIDILTYVGLPSVLGRLIDRHTFLEARQHCKEWAQGKDALFAAKCAANFLKWSLLSPLAGDGRSDHCSPFDELLHHRWAQYHSALILWTLYRATRGSVQAISCNKNGSGIQFSGSSGSRPVSASWPDKEQQGQLNQQILLDLATPSADEVFESAYHVLNWAANIAVDEQVGEKRGRGEAIEGEQHPSKSVTPMPSPLAVLILVERALRGCRWQHLREANDVLLRLIRQEEQDVPEPPTMPASPLRSP